MQTAIKEDEWQEILFDLLQHHSLFYKIGEMGKPYLTDIIETACVTFTPDGEFINFLFNEDFWKNTTRYEKLFVICHECLHIILSHGKRFRDAKQREFANVAMDIVVNHTLVNRFGFVKEQITDYQDYCWVDTVFPEKTNYKMEISQDETSEYYFNLLMRTKKQDASSVMRKLVDSHDFLDGDDKQLFEKLNSELSAEEKDTLKKFYQKHTSAGNSTSSTLHFASKEQLQVKRKWESAITKWTKNIIKSSEKIQDQWARQNRRFAMINSSMFLPSEMEIEDSSLAQNKIEVHFYLDTSGSCWHLKDRFFNAAASLPKKLFDVQLFCFDTKVYPTELASRKMYGGGGTNFDIIEANIQKAIADNKKKYPDAVWVMSDGFGTSFKPERPANWYWFLTKESTKEFLPQQSKVYSLSDFV